MVWIDCKFEYKKEEPITQLRDPSIPFIHKLDSVYNRDNRIPHHVHGFLVIIFTCIAAKSPQHV